jgi:hypothetical protein
MGLAGLTVSTYFDRCNSLFITRSSFISRFTVNEHGIVHQTTTFKSTIDSAVVCLGGAETRDR